MPHFILIICSLAMFLYTTMAPVSPAKKKNDSYLMAFYLGDGRTGLHLAWSDDGLQWHALKKGKSFVRPGVGDYVMREPHLLAGPDGLYHLVWSTGAKRMDVGYTRSKDLINWEPQRLIPIKDLGEQAVAVVSPELFFDAMRQEYWLYWSTEMAPAKDDNKSTDEDGFEDDKAPKTNSLTEKRYLAFKKTTNDFLQFSKSEAFFQPDASIRDLHLVKDTAQYLLFFRDETARPKNVQRNLKYATARYPEGPYSSLSTSVSGKSYILSPFAFKTDSTWIVMAERYKEGKIGVYRTKDFVKFDDYSDSIKYPKGIRPTCVLTVSQKILKKLKEEE